MMSMQRDVLVIILIVLYQVIAIPLNPDTELSGVTKQFTLETNESIKKATSKWGCGKKCREQINLLKMVADVHNVKFTPLKGKQKKKNQNGNDDSRNTAYFLKISGLLTRHSRSTKSNGRFF